MWNSLEIVAENQLLDASKFSAFALANAAVYRLDNGYVSSWHVDKLINDYRASRDVAELNAERDVVLQEIRKRYSIA